MVAGLAVAAAVALPLATVASGQLATAEQSVATVKIAEYPYIAPLSLAELGRGDEALPVLRELEQTMRTRVPGFVIAARTLLEGNTAESVAAVGRIVASGFKDPEGLFYLSRHFAHLNEVGPAFDLVERVVAGGFFCYPAMANDPWLSSLRKKPAFTKLLHQADKQWAALPGSASCVARAESHDGLREPGRCPRALCRTCKTCVGSRGGRLQADWRRTGVPVE